MKALGIFLLPLLLFGIELSELIEYAKNKHTSLKVIEQKLSSIDNEYEISRNFDDPTLSLSMSDIQFDDPSNRSIEPMQYTAINFKQKIPYFGKLDAKSEKVSAKKELVSLTLDKIKVKLVKEIKIISYSIWQKEKELKIIDEYIKLTKQKIELYSAYGSSDSKSHMSIISAEMALSELKIRQSKLSSALVGFYKKLSYLSAIEVKTIELDMLVSKPKDINFYIETKNTNISYKIKKAILKVADKDVKIQELSSYIDPVVQVGYYHRNSYEDYANIGVSFSLPIYGTQESQTELFRKLSLAKKSEITDFDNSLDVKIVNAHAKIKSSYEIYDIIQNQSMPQIEHMFELSSSSIKSGDELYIYISLLEKKLSLDEKNIKIIAQYHKAQATLDALIGEIK